MLQHSRICKTREMLHLARKKSTLFINRVVRDVHAHRRCACTSRKCACTSRKCACTLAVCMHMQICACTPPMCLFLEFFLSKTWNHPCSMFACTSIDVHAHWRCTRTYRTGDFHENMCMHIGWHVHAHILNVHAHRHRCACTFSQCACTSKICACTSPRCMHIFFTCGRSSVLFEMCMQIADGHAHGYVDTHISR